MAYLKIENNVVVGAVDSSAEYIATLPGTYVLNEEFNIGDEFPTYDGTTFTKAVETTDPEAVDAPKEARAWRDMELMNTDFISQIPDHSKRGSYIAYRQELRDWPSTPSFPLTRPVF